MENKYNISQFFDIWNNLLISTNIVYIYIYTKRFYSEYIIRERGILIIFTFVTMDIKVFTGGIEFEALTCFFFWSLFFYLCSVSLRIRDIRFKMWVKIIKLKLGRAGDKGSVLSYYERGNKCDRFLSHVSLKKIYINFSSFYSVRL